MKFLLEKVPHDVAKYMNNEELEEETKKKIEKLHKNANHMGRPPLPLWASKRKVPPDPSRQSEQTQTADIARRPQAWPAA